MKSSRLLGAFNTRTPVFEKRSTELKVRAHFLFAGVYKAAASMVLAGFFCQAGAASWTDVYYELGNENTQAGNAYISPTHLTSSIGEAVDTIQTLNGKATITAYASPGVLKTSVWNIADVQSQPQIGVSDYSFATTQASFFDQLIITPADSALIGLSGTVNGYLLLSGDTTATWNVFNNNSSYFDVYARSTLQVSGTGISGFITARENQGNSGGTITNISVPAPMSIPVSFASTLGSLTGIQYNMNLQGYSSASFGFRECGGGYGPCGSIVSAELIADYSNSLLWGGINSVTDASGNFIDFTVTSASGFNYLTPAPVPVPASVWLLGTGLVGLIGLSRRKKAA